MVYFEETQVKSLILTLRNHFPGAELVFDAFSGLIVWANNCRMSRTRLSARYHWGLSKGKDLESWGEGIHLQDEYRYLDKDEPRLAHLRWMRYIPPLANSSGIFHFRLGDLA